MLCNALDSSETSKHVLFNGLKHVLQVARQAYSFVGLSIACWYLILVDYYD